MLIYLTGSIVIIHSYIGLRQKGDEIAEELKRVKASEEELKKRLYQTQQKVAFLKDYISSVTPERLIKRGVNRAQKKGIPKEAFSRLNKATTLSKPKVAQASVKKTSEAKAQEQASKPPPQPAPNPEPQPKVRLDIRRLSTSRDQTHINVSFRLYKLTNGARPAEGYVHLLALNEKHDPPILGNWPSTRLKDGMPEDFKAGEPFLIKKSYRTIRGKFAFPNPETLPEVIRILVYDKQGRILLDKKVPCEPAQKTKPPPSTPPP